MFVHQRVPNLVNFVEGKEWKSGVYKQRDREREKVTHTLNAPREKKKKVALIIHRGKANGRCAES